MCILMCGFAVFDWKAPVIQLCNVSSSLEGVFLIADSLISSSVSFVYLCDCRGNLFLKGRKMASFCY
jgi:hypothetical protein